MQLATIRSLGPVECYAITKALKDVDALRALNSGIFLLKEAENQGVEEIVEMLNLRKCIDKRLETFKMPDEQTEAENENRYCCSYNVEVYRMTKEVNVTLKEYFEMKKANGRKFLGEEKKEEENKKKEDKEEMVGLNLNNCTIVSILNMAKSARQMFSIFSNIQDPLPIWNGILVLIDAEDEGIEKLAEISNLRKSVNKRLKTLKMPDCFSDIEYGYYIEHYIKGYQMAQKLKITLPEYFNKPMNEIEKKHKKEQRRNINEKVNEYLNKGEEKLETATSMAAFTHTRSLFLKSPVITAVSTFGVVVRKTVPMTANVCSSFWKSCVDLFYLSLAYRMRRIPFHFKKRSCIELIMQRRK